MEAKSLTANGDGDLRGETLLSPADFPIGSVQSRAAMRTRLLVLAGAQREHCRLSEEDEDALILYARGCFWIRGNMRPDCHEFAAFPIYARGMQVHEELFGPPVPVYLDPEPQRRVHASYLFSQIHDREPQQGDSLSYRDVNDFHASQFGKWTEFIEAWSRRITAFPCPIRVEGKSVFNRMRPRVRDGECFWNEDRHNTAEGDWITVEADALGERASWDAPPDYQPTLQSVEFCGVVNGKDRWRAGGSDVYQFERTARESA